MPRNNGGVIIVGAGPVGLTAALALARRGIPNVVLAVRDTNRDARSDPVSFHLACFFEGCPGTAHYSFAM
jgi:thioredoxin reductase